MVPTMSTPTGSGDERRSFAQRLAADISRSEEDVRDWTNGPGQVWLGAIVVASIVAFIWFGFFA